MDTELADKFTLTHHRKQKSGKSLTEKNCCYGFPPTLFFFVAFLSFLCLFSGDGTGEKIMENDPQLDDDNAALAAALASGGSSPVEYVELDFMDLGQFDEHHHSAEHEEAQELDVTAYLDVVEPTANPDVSLAAHDPLRALHCNRSLQEALRSQLQAVKLALERNEELQVCLVVGFLCWCAARLWLTRCLCFLLSLESSS
jgi:hypothetical protein